VTRIRHRMYLRRYIKLHPGAPDSFDCAGGWHEAKVFIGDCERRGRARIRGREAADAGATRRTLADQV
jgi:hypothetical protein